LSRQNGLNQFQDFSFQFLSVQWNLKDLWNFGKKVVLCKDKKNERIGHLLLSLLTNSFSFEQMIYGLFHIVNLFIVQISVISGDILWNRVTLYESSSQGPRWSYFVELYLYSQEWVEIIRAVKEGVTLTLPDGHIGWMGIRKDALITVRDSLIGMRFETKWEQTEIEIK